MTGNYQGSLPTASSTGNQRSSRLLSMKSSNLLLCLPQGTAAKKVLKQGESVTGLVIGALLPPTSATACFHKDIVSQNVSSVSSPATTASAAVSGSSVPTARMEARVGLLTVSDRVSHSTAQFSL